MDWDYQEIIPKVSGQVAEKFLEKEKNIAERAVLTDADISEITRQIGLETTIIVLENTCEGFVKKTGRRAEDSERADNSV